MNDQARFSGRQKAATLSPAKAGSGIVVSPLPRAALRSTSFRCAGPGLHSAAGFAGSLIGPVLKSFCLAFVLVLLAFASACKKTNYGEVPPHPPDNVRSSADVVKVNATSVPIPAGGDIDAIVTLSISPGFHVNANPATFSYLIATEVKASKVEGIIVGTPGYPAAVKKKFQFADEPLAVYEGEAQIKLPLRAETNATKGAQSLPISVKVQACDHEKCYAPDTLKATIAMDVR